MIINDKVLCKRQQDSSSRLSGLPLIWSSSNRCFGFYILYLFSETDSQCRELITLSHASRVLSVNDEDNEGRVQCKRKYDSLSRLSDLPLLATAHVCLPSLAFTARTSSHKLMLRVVPLPASVRMALSQWPRFRRRSRRHRRVFSSSDLEHGASGNGYTTRPEDVERRRPGSTRRWLAHATD